MNLGNTTLSQKARHKRPHTAFAYISLIGNVQNRQICRGRNEINGCLGLGRRARAQSLQFFLKRSKRPKTDCGCPYMGILNSQFKWVGCMACELYLRESVKERKHEGRKISERLFQ